MGFTLFTQSGTFDPASYGLKVGDALHIICVGGGGGGSRANNSSTSSYNGSNGSSSSFGTLVTSAGGSGGKTTRAQTAPPTVVAGSNPGGTGSAVTFGGSIYYCPGSGGDGWLPGFFGSAGQNPLTYLPSLLSSLSSSSSGSVSSTFSFPFPNGSQIYAQRSFNMSLNGSGNEFSTIGTANTLPYGHPGYLYTYNGSNYQRGISAGGVGYGAGGGCGSGNYGSHLQYGEGGHSGVINQKDIVLTSINSIAVTVGNGGAGYDTNGYGGGGGARGCVAVYW